MSKLDNLTEDQILDILEDKYGLPEWVFSRHVRNAPGFTRHARYIDGYAFHCYLDKDDTHRGIAFEVKISRQDFMNEIKKPEKRQDFMELSSEFYYVVPWGLISVDEVPEGCGLIYINKSFKTIRKKIAKQTKIDQIPSFFVKSLIRNIEREKNITLRKYADKIPHWAIEVAGKKYDNFNDFDKVIHDKAKKLKTYELRQKIRKEEKKRYNDCEEKIIAPLINFLRSKGITVWGNFDSKVNQIFEKFENLIDEHHLTQKYKENMENIRRRLIHAQDDIDDFLKHCNSGEGKDNED